MQIQKEWLDFLREQYPKGSRIRLTEMKDDPYALSPGSMGTLKYIDDDAQFHISWDNGSGLALRIGEDRFRVLLPEPQTLKFYMPLTAQLYGRDSWGDLEEYGNDLNGRDLRDYPKRDSENLCAGSISGREVASRRESARGTGYRLGVHWTCVCQSQEAFQTRWAESSCRLRRCSLPDDWCVRCR